jgi:hypothetical protein
MGISGPRSRMICLEGVSRWNGWILSFVCCVFVVCVCIYLCLVYIYTYVCVCLLYVYCTYVFVAVCYVCVSACGNRVIIITIIFVITLRSQNDIKNRMYSIMRFIDFWYIIFILFCFFFIVMLQILEQRRRPSWARRTTVTRR